MAKLLVPPQRTESSRGFLWWKKSTVEFRGRILKPEQAEACGISMFRALAAEFPNRKRIESISGLIIGDVEATFHAYESFTHEAELVDSAARWLLEEVAYFSIGFETPNGQIIRSLDYETIDGRRALATSRPMDADETTAATERVKTGLQRMLDEHQSEQGGAPNP
ncbi:hypothetical protein [Haloferula sp.]|uniref:hypothetical protein n=1 Tax=Haloferula sp. TaxID=2497595 RepID=UPI00329B34BC